MPFVIKFPATFGQSSETFRILVCLGYWAKKADRRIDFYGVRSGVILRAASLDSDMAK